VPNSHAVVRDGVLESTVDEAFEEPTWLFREQLAELTAAARTKSPHQH